LIVFICGTISNIVHFTVQTTVQQGVQVPIAVVALNDAAKSAHVFMHVTQLWRPED